MRRSASGVSGSSIDGLTGCTTKFSNYELGVKWDAQPALAVTGAVYRLDRTNTRSLDPNDPTRIVQTGSQRTNGVELGVTGDVSRSWRVAASMRIRTR